MLCCGWLIWCWCGFVGCLAFHWVWYLVQWASMFSLAVCGYRWFLGCLWVGRIGPCLLLYLLDVWFLGCVVVGCGFGRFGW